MLTKCLQMLTRCLQMLTKKRRCFTATPPQKQESRYYGQTQARGVFTWDYGTPSTLVSTRQWIVIFLCLIVLGLDSDLADAGLEVLQVTSLADDRTDLRHG